MGWTEGRTGTAHGYPGVALRVDGPLSEDELAALCRRVDTLIRYGCAACDAGVLVCDIAGIDTADLRLVDQLAQAHLAARRAGGTLVFRRVGTAMKGLLSLVGLDEVLLTDNLPRGVRAASVERERQAEEREEPGVEEDVEVRHPPL